MELLEAVNTVLPYLGEHIIDSIDTTRHPTVDLIKAAVERARRELIAEGWWFNEAHLRIGVNSDGKMDKPQDTLAIYGLNYNVAVKDTRLFNLSTNSEYFTEPLNARVVKDVEFNDLPYYAAAAVVYKAAVEVYTADFGSDNTLQILDSKYAEARRMLVQENLRNRRWNSENSIRVRSKAFKWLRR